MSVRRFQNEGIGIKGDTKANLDLLPRQAGTILHATDEGKLYFDDGSQLIDLTLGAGSVSSINDLSDVDTATNPPSTGDRLEYDGTNWVPVTPGGGGASANIGLSARIQGSLGAGVTVTSENVSGWVDSVTRNNAGEYTINYASQGFTETPCILVAIENNGAIETSTQYILSESSTQAQIKLGLVDQDGDRDFSIHVIPVGADASTPGVGFYAGRVSSGRVVGSQNTAFLDSVTGSANEYILNYSGLGLTQSPTVVVTPVDIDGTPTGNDLITSVIAQSSTSTTVKFTFNSGATPTPNFNVILVPAAADNTPFASNIAYAADIDITSGSGVVSNENISGWIDTATRNSIGNLTINFASLGLTVPPAVYVIGRDPAPVGFFAPSHNQGVTASTATFIMSADGQTARADHAVQVIIIPQDVDFNLT